MSDKLHTAFVIAAIIGLMIFILPGNADRIRPMNLEQLTEGAEIVFEGECTSMRSGKDPDSGLMATWYTFRVTNVLKGKLDEEFILKQYGGREGDVEVTSPSARYEPGESVILFLYGISRLGFSSAVGLTQGKFSIKVIPDTQTRYVTNGMPSMILFEKMETVPPALNAQGIRAKGQEILRSDKLELVPFVTEVRKIVERQEKSQRLQKQ